MSVGLFECLLNGELLILRLERGQAGRPFEDLFGSGMILQQSMEVRRGDDGAFDEHKGIFQGVLQFTDISGPWVPYELPQDPRIHTADVFLVFAVESADKLVNQQWNVR
jgi:hypothetical protein